MWSIAFQKTLNCIGDKLKYDRCPISGDSFFGRNFYYIQGIDVGFLQNSFGKYNSKDLALKLVSVAKEPAIKKAVSRAGSLDSFIDLLASQLADSARYLGYLPKESASS